MRITWSLPQPGESVESGRGDLVRARSLVQALRTLGHDVDVVAASERAGTAAAVQAYRGVVRRRFPPWVGLALRTGGRLALARSHARRVAAHARGQGAHLIVETQMHGIPSGARAARMAGIPLVLDDCSPPQEEAALGTALLTVTVGAFRHQGARAAALTVSSEALAQRLERERLPRARMAVIPNGVDPVRFTRIERESVRRRLGLQGRLVVGFVGSFQPWHGVDLLLEAVAMLDPAIPLQVLLVGEGAGRTPALARAARLGLADRVTALGSLPQVRIPGVLSACDIGVLPGSNDYGQPMKLVEYAAAGLPAVAPDLPPVREMIQDRRTGLLFPPGNALEMAERITWLARDPALQSRLGRAARETALERTWFRSALLMSETLEAALRQGALP
jgi:glycosyltransferase involved in cell wall biosynthesis